MVRQVRRFCIVFVVLLTTAAAICGSVSAATYNAYDGNISSSQLTYFRDILPAIKLGDNYVVCRTDQYQYIMITGDLDYSNGVFTLNGDGTVYQLDNSSSNYNSYYTYSHTNLADISLSVGSKIVYSDIGGYPQLEERGQKYEVLQTILIAIACVCFVIRCIFYPRKR